MNRRREASAAPDDERRLLARARAVVTAQAAGAVTCVVALVGVLVCFVMVRGEESSARHDLAVAIARADLAHPPPCVWLFELRDGTVTGSPGAPAYLPVRTGLRAVAADGRARVHRARIAGRAYLVRTAWRSGVVRQAVIDLQYQSEERARLYVALSAAEVAGLVAAVLIGRSLSRRAIVPLADALSRQRRFVADASHELRTPLARLHTRSQLLERRIRAGAEPAELAEQIHRVVTDTRQFGEVIDDLLLSAQLGHTRRWSGTVDLAAVAEEVAGAESARAEERGVSIVVECADAGPHLVRGVEAALRRVVGALLDNALGHTSSGGHVAITVARERDQVKLCVLDDGVGFDPRDAERLFARFARGEHGQGRRFGLGLALVREVVVAHGGTIAAVGTPGAGAVFAVCLPAADSAPGPLPAGPTSSEPAPDDGA